MIGLTGFRAVYLSGLPKIHILCYHISREVSLIASLAAYIPWDRYQVIATGQELPGRTYGAALFADISGFTPLTETLARELGPKRGADELTRQLNRVYEALIAPVHRYGGSVIGFSGDAITCWFDQDSGRQATACALAMQQAMVQFARIETLFGASVSLAIKVAVTTGPVRRFRVGDPHIQYLDVLAGSTMDRLALTEHVAQKGEVVLSPETIAQLNHQVQVAEWRQEATERFAVISGLTEPTARTINPTAPLPVSGRGWGKGPESVGDDPSTLEPFPQGSLTEAQLRPWLLPPVYDRLHSGQEQFLAELRPVVALFLKFGGLEYDQDEAAGEKLDAYIRLAQNILAYYEGYLIQLTTGDKGSYFYAAFGAPLARDEAATQAVAAALELRSLPAELNFITAPHIGLSQGRMRTGAYGSLTRCTYGALGDETNVAARLMQKAEPGQILVSSHVFEAAAKAYRFKYLGPLALKGKQNQLPTYLVLDRQPTPGSTFISPLVGREAELAQTGAVIEAVWQGQGHLLRLEGVAGIGKSHLAEVALQQGRERGLQVGRGSAHSTSQGIPYASWRQIFRALFNLGDEQAGAEGWAQQIGQVEAQLNQLNPAWQVRLPLLGDLLGLPIPDNATTSAFDAKLRQEARLALAVELLQHWAGRQPMLLLLEDIHWLDEASQQLALALSRVITAMPLGLILTQRPAEPPVLPELNELPVCQHLALTELPSPAMRSLVSHTLQGPPSTLLLDLIQAYAQGNPFFTEELLDTLRELDYLRLDAQGRWTLAAKLMQILHRANCLVKDRHREEWVLRPQAPLSAVALDIPDSLHGLVLARLDRLHEALKLTIKVASVIGQSFEFDLLAQSHPAQPDPATLREQLQALEARDLVYLQPQTAEVLETSAVSIPGKGLYHFKHNIIQEVAYQTLLHSQQQQLHQAVGHSLESWQPEAVERLAYHYLHSGDRSKTLHYLDQAARKTQREYANETALNYYTQALTLEDRWEWRKGQVEILHLLGQRAEEREALEALSERLEEGKDALCVPSVGVEAGPGSEITPVEDSPRLPASSPPRSPAAFETAYLWGQYYEAVSEYAQAQAAIARALEASQEAGDLAGEVRCLTQLGLVAYRKGDYEQANIWYNKALALFQTETIYSNYLLQAFTQAFNGLGEVYNEQGKFEQAQSCYQQALALSRRSSDEPGEAKTLFGLGVTAFYQRQFVEAQVYYYQVLTIQRTMGDRVGEGASLYSLAQIFSDTGDYNQAQTNLSAALTILQATGNRWDEIYVWNDLGILYQELGDLPRAQVCLEQGLKLAEQIGTEEGQVYLLSNLGLVMRDQGNLIMAKELLDKGLDLVQAMENERQIAFFLSYLGSVCLQAGHLEQAMEQAKTALTLWQTLGLHLRVVDDLVTVAATSLASGELTQALTYAEQALALLTECSGEGPEFPQRDYFVCYQVLSVAGQTERARAALQSAYNLVMARVEKITDDALRQSFLEKVAINREIVATYHHREILKHSV